jgi:hypothetical protein
LVPHLGNKTLEKQILGPSVKKKTIFGVKGYKRFLVKTDLKFELLVPHLGVKNLKKQILGPSVKKKEFWAFGRFKGPKSKRTSTLILR